jgi:hypothetical protein
MQTHQNTPNEPALAYDLNLRLIEGIKPARGGGEPPSEYRDLAPIWRTGFEYMRHECFS